MSLSQLIDEHVSTVFLNTDHFAETFLRYRANASTISVTGILTVQQPQVNDDRGRGFSHSASLWFKSTTDIEPHDRLKGDVNWQVSTVTEAEHGARTATLVRYEPEVRGKSNLRTGDL